MVELVKYYRMIIAYDGTAYQGWQFQPNGRSIQEEIQKALCILLKKDASIVGSGRTDAGVHAKGQVAHFKHTLLPGQLELDLYRFLASINGLLPADISVKKVEEVSADFHARYSAVSKIYHYHLLLNPVADPFERLYSWHVRKQIDKSALLKARDLIVGTHDFTSFANEAHRGAAAKDAVRNLFRLDVVEQENGVRLEFEANGFLYKMVRNLTGLLVAVSLGRVSVVDIPAIFAAREREKAPVAAPAHGLFLMRVNY